MQTKIYYHQLMHFLIFITFVTITICHGWGGPGYCSNQSEYVQSTECNLYYRVCQSSSFTFIKCVYPDSSGGSITSLSESTCISNCCKNSVSNFNSQKDVKNCEKQASSVSSNNSQSSNTSWLTIFFYVLGAVGGFLLLISTVAVIYFCFVKNKSLFNRQIRVMDLGKADQATAEDIKSIKSFEKVKQVGNDDTCCSICLQSGVNCATACSHKFHLKCILGWISRRQTCPLCQRSNLHQFRYFCQKCNKNYISLQSKNPTKKKQVLKMIDMAQKFSCQSCNKKQTFKIQQIVE